MIEAVWVVVSMLVFALLALVWRVLPWVVLAAALVWVAATVVDRWDEPEYPHAGYCPDAPVWEE